MGRPRSTSSLGSEILMGGTAPALSTMRVTSSQVSRLTESAVISTAFSLQPSAPSSVRALSADKQLLDEQREASRTRRRVLKSKSSPKAFFTWYRELSYRHTWGNSQLHTPPLSPTSIVSPAISIKLTCNCLGETFSESAHFHGHNTLWILGEPDSFQPAAQLHLPLLSLAKTFIISR